MLVLYLEVRPVPLVEELSVVVCLDTEVVDWVLVMVVQARGQAQYGSRVGQLQLEHFSLKNWIVILAGRGGADLIVTIISSTGPTVGVVRSGQFDSQNVLQTIANQEQLEGSLLVDQHHSVLLVRLLDRGLLQHDGLHRHPGVGAGRAESLQVWQITKVRKSMRFVLTFREPDLI